MIKGEVVSITVSFSVGSSAWLKKMLQISNYSRTNARMLTGFACDCVKIRVWHFQKKYDRERFEAKFDLVDLII